MNVSNHCQFSRNLLVVAWTFFFDIDIYHSFSRNLEITYLLSNTQVEIIRSSNKINFIKCLLTVPHYHIKLIDLYIWIVFLNKTTIRRDRRKRAWERDRERTFNKTKLLCLIYIILNKKLFERDRFGTSNSKSG